MENTSVRVPSFQTLFQEVFSFWQEHVQHLVFVTFVGFLIAFGPLGVVFVAFLLLAAAGVGGPALVLLGLLGILAALWCVVGSAAAQIMLLQVVFQGNASDIKTLVKGAFEQTLLIRFIFGTIAMGLLVMAGFICFVVPGIFLLVPATYFPYLLISGKKSIWETIKNAIALSRGFWWVTVLRTGWLALAFTIISNLINAVGMRVVYATDASPGMAGFVMLVTGLVSLAFSVVATPLLMIMTRRLYEVISGFKAANPEAGHKLAGAEIGQLIGLIVVWMIASTFVSVVQPDTNSSGVPGYSYPSDWNE